jgi:glycosyltransferase involved in cell wall biosynthesis
VVVDDGSKDDTRALVERYRSDPRVVYIRQEHGGLPKARNAGIEASRGEHIAFIDGDDMFVREKVEKQVRLLDSGRDVDVAYTSERYFIDGAPGHSFPSPYEKLSGDLLFFLKRSNFIHVSTVMVRRSSLGSIRFDPDLKSHEDWDFFLRLAEKGRRFRCLHEELSLIRARGDSMTTEAPVMDSSRRLVGERARTMWADLKGGINLNTREGIRRLARYLMLKTRAMLLNFPDSPRFNRPLPYRKGA